MAGQELRSGALRKLNNMFLGFSESLVHIQEVERLFKLENDAAADHRYLCADVRQDNMVPELTNQLVSANQALMKTIMGRVKNFIESIPEMQEMLVGIDRSFRAAAPGEHAFDEGVMLSKQLVKVTTEAEVGKASKAAKRRCTDQQWRRVSLCRHTCGHHPELMDISLWKKLPTEVVERVCAYLPLSHIFGLCTERPRSRILDLVRASEPPGSFRWFFSEWSSIPASVSFRQACAKAHPKVLGIFGTNLNSVTSYLLVFDFRSYKWLNLELSDIPCNFSVFNVQLFGHDGGLICLLPISFNEVDDDPLSILVFNPLTGDRKFVPLSAASREAGVAVLLQLQMDTNTGSYQLSLVTRSGSMDDPVYGAESYDSKSGLWSTMDSGIVYGIGAFETPNESVSQLLIFDCTLKRFTSFSHSGVDCAYVGDQFLVLDADLEVSTNVWEGYWRSLPKKWMFLQDVPECYTTRFFASNSFMLVVADDPSLRVFEHRHQRIVLIDRKTGNERVDVPQFLNEDLADNSFFMNDLEFMCDLSWDAVP